MNRFSKWALVLLAVLSVRGAASNRDTTLTEAERKEVRDRIARFYRDRSDPTPMNEAPPKYSLNESRFVPPKKPPSSAEMVGDPLLRQAQWKGTALFQIRYCEEVLRKKFPEIECEKPEGARATIEANDRVEKLVGTWIEPGNLVSELDGIPAMGETGTPIWSDDYWRTRYGQTSYRYSGRGGFGSYVNAVGHYSQPGEWEGVSRRFDLTELARQIIPWSPSEKYDLTMGDETFSLTKEQKREGEKYKTLSGDVEDWMGLCHGWAAASVMVPPPKHSAKFPGPKGVEVTWYPFDVRSMMTLVWANGSTYNNFIGGRCSVRNPAVYPNGRLIQQECFDSNPATFHLSLGNLVGKAKLSFIFDATYDYEVWNQPVKSYEFTYFNPLDQAKTSKNWREVAVDYDAKFKGIDRFQTPLTRGLKKSGGGADDSGIKKIVGVIATTVYLIEFTPPPHLAETIENSIQRVTYTYDLELHEEEGKFIPRGGEWHLNAHPDFLWVPKKDTYARTSFDFIDLEFTGTEPVRPEATETSKQASQYGYPLCQALKALVAKTSDKDGVRCPVPRG